MGTFCTQRISPPHHIRILYTPLAAAPEHERSSWPCFGFTVALISDSSSELVAKAQRKIDIFLNVNFRSGVDLNGFLKQSKYLISLKKLYYCFLSYHLIQVTWVFTEIGPEREKPEISIAFVVDKLRCNNVVTTL